MRRFTLFLGLSVIALAVQAQPRQLEIPAGAAYEIQPSQAVLQLDRLVIGNGAQLRFAPGVDRWTLLARRTVIGNGVVIDASGWQGLPGDAGEVVDEPAQPCDDGVAGSAGAAGGPAGDGVTLDLSLGLLELGDLQIVTDGGAGGSGGAGAPGQYGGDIQRCRAGDGGDGGLGGTGGTGGNGGDVKLVYHVQSEAAAALRERIRVSALGGTGGGGGLGGPGGGARDGEYLRGSGGGPGGKKWLAGGRPGSRGADGAPGSPGVGGDVQISAVQPVAPDTSRRGVAEPGGDELSILRRRLERLEQRVRQLEAQPE